MVLDIILVAIVLIFAIYGFRKGFVFTLIHTVGWIIALAGAYLLTPRFEDFLREHTGFYDFICSSISSKLDVSLETVEVMTNSLPLGIQPKLTGDSSDFLQSYTTAFADIFITILAFIILFIAIKIVLWLISKIFARDYKGGFVHFADGLFGTIFGLLKGVIICYLLMALLVPLTNMLSTDLTSVIDSQLNSSFLAKNIYDDNYLVMLLQGYIGK